MSSGSVDAFRDPPPMDPLCSIPRLASLHHLSRIQLPYQTSLLPFGLATSGITDTQQYIAPHDVVSK